ncbi:MAG: ABC transporter permease [Clostridia bacterium]|nr:ABC transporter permease [Clostridia bacterium]
MSKNGKGSGRTLSGLLDALGQPVIAVLISFLIGAVILFASGYNPLTAYGTMITGAFGKGFYLSSTLSRATPIIMGGLAVCIAWRSGYECMGGEGQMIFGAMVSALICYYMPGPGIVRILVAFAAACLVGALYCMFSGWLWHRFKVTFVISTLMLNYIANYVCSYLTLYVFRDPASTDINATQTGKLIESARIGRIDLPGLVNSLPDGLPFKEGLVKYFKGFNLHWGFVITVVLVILTWVLLKKTVFGYRSRMNGLNDRFALYGGVAPVKMLYVVMFLSGAAAALGGSFEVLGSKYRYVDQMIFSTGYAWSGMVAALLANFDPFGTMFASILLAALATGGAAMQRSAGIPIETVKMIEGVIMLLMSVKLLRLFAFRHKAKTTATADEKGGDEE